MAAQRERPMMTVEDYLALEVASPVKHQYVDGQVYAMAGGTVDHDRIANTVRALLDAHLGDGPCAVLGPDVRLRVNPTIYYYPDAFVTCDMSIDGEALEVGTPRLIVEVLSSSTESDDRGDKFANYQTIATLEEYLLVNSRRRAVEVFRRAEHGLWLYQQVAPDDAVALATIGLTCPVAAFYRRTQL